MISSVSVVSDFVANGQQIIPNDSSFPSKIPFGGFSSLCLQTGIPVIPSPGLMRETRFFSDPADLSAAIAPVSPPIVSESPRQFNEKALQFTPHASSTDPPFISRQTLGNKHRQGELRLITFCFQDSRLGGTLSKRKDPERRSNGIF